MGMQSLAETVILNSIDELYDERYMSDSLRFFSSKDFSYFAEMAGMDQEAQLKVLRMVHDIMRQTSSTKKLVTRKAITAGRAKSSPQALPAPSPYIG